MAPDHGAARSVGQWVPVICSEGVLNQGRDLPLVCAAVPPCWNARTRACLGVWHAPKHVMHNAVAGSFCVAFAGAPPSAVPPPAPRASCGAGARAAARAPGCATGYAMQRVGVLSPARAQVPLPAEEPPQKRGPRDKKQAVRAAANPPGEHLTESEARPCHSGARALLAHTPTPADKCLPCR